MFVAMENQKVQVIKDMVENLNEFYGLSIEVETLVEKSEREAKEQQNAIQDEGETQNE
jgi:succinate dehydrogenase/fumarate reductase-like Fe-S protein